MHKHMQVNIMIAFGPKFRHVIRRLSQSAKAQCRDEPGIPSNLSVSTYAYDDGIAAKIGLEVHAQLKVKSKLFSSGSAELGGPNTQLDLLDIALPGTLPVLNKAAVEAGLLSSLALNSTPQECIHFDRKNYFYADMPAGYQITQKDKPLAKHGYLDFIVTNHQKNITGHALPYDLIKYLYLEERLSTSECQPYMKRSRITQIQLEQDSAKSLHELSSEHSEPDFSLVDYNRCGSSLIEIVFEPDLENHHEASSLIKQLIITLKSIGTCDCELQEGSLRVDANVSVHQVEGEAIDKAQRVELKNLNSLGFVNRAILYEVKRQANLIKSGHRVQQETRHFDYRSGQTIPLRLKEDVVDYRYVPEPNIPPIRLDHDFVDTIRAKLPEKLPADTMRTLVDDYHLDLALIPDMMQMPGLTQYYERVMQGKSYEANVICDFLIYTCSHIKNVLGGRCKFDLNEGSEFLRALSPVKMQEICDMMTSDLISYTSALEVVKYLVTVDPESSPRQVVEYLKLEQINDEDEVIRLCRETLSQMKNIPRQFRKKGKKKDLRMMVDKVMQSCNNRVNVRKAIRYMKMKYRPEDTDAD